MLSLAADEGASKMLKGVKRWTGGRIDRHIVRKADRWMDRRTDEDF